MSFLFEAFSNNILLLGTNWNYNLIQILQFQSWKKSHSRTRKFYLFQLWVANWKLKLKGSFKVRWSPDKLLSQTSLMCWPRPSNMCRTFDVTFCRTFDIIFRRTGRIMRPQEVPAGSRRYRKRNDGIDVGRRRRTAETTTERHLKRKIETQQSWTFINTCFIHKLG